MCLGEPHSKMGAATTESLPQTRLCSKDVIPINSSDPHSNAEEILLPSQFDNSLCGFDLVLFQNLYFQYSVATLPLRGSKNPGSGLVASLCFIEEGTKAQRGNGLAKGHTVSGQKGLPLPPPAAWLAGYIRSKSHS